MKRFILLPAAILFACIACNKPETGKEKEKEVIEEKDKTVTIKVSLPELSASKATASYDAASGVFKSTWSEEDKVKVVASGQESEFALSSGAGESIGEFTGKLPSDVKEIDIQFPAVEKSLSEQDYAEGVLSYELLKASATDCQVESTIALKSDNSVVKVGCFGDLAVSKIVVTNTTTEDTYTLNCGADGVAPNMDEKSPKDFFIVVPKGDTPWKYKVDVYILQKPEAPFANIEESSETVDAGKIYVPKPVDCTASIYNYLKGAVEIDGVTWAPVNCGATKDNPNGLLYQWGRKYGQPYDAGTLTPVEMTIEQGESAEFAGKFGKSNEYVLWYTDALNMNLWKDSEKTAYDPCPDGWRVPTKAQFESLIANRSQETVVDGFSHGFYYTGSKQWTEGQGVYMPESGFRHYYKGENTRRNDTGYYWCTTVQENYKNPYFLDFSSNDNRMIFGSYWGYGMSIRCVKL